MSAKMTRITYEVLYYGRAISGIIGFAFLFFAAGALDFYTIELKTDVPGDLDIKYLTISTVFILIMLVFDVILKINDYDDMYSLDNIPIKYSRRIARGAHDNIVFERQLNKAVRSYLNGDWGELDDVHYYNNERAINKRTGALCGIYRTAFGEVYIRTNHDRSVTRVMFASEC